MATLTGKQVGAFRDALLAAFTPNELRQMVRVELDEKLDQLVAPGTFKVNVFDLIEWAENQGETDALLAGAVRTVPGNPTLKRFNANYTGSIQRAVSHQRLEKIVDQNQTFKKPRRWRDRLERIERQVCRIERSGKARGTGFLVSPGIVLTNHHVVAKEIAGAPATELTARFDYHIQDAVDVPQPGRPCQLAGDWLIDSSPHDPIDTKPKPKDHEPDHKHLDYAFVRLAEEVGRDDVDGEKRGFLALPEDPPELEVDGPVFIVQHPGGDTMSLAMNTQSIDEVVEVAGHKTRVRHRTNTKGGSSGSPCFDSDWNLVILHHSGDPALIKPEYNEGIPIQTIRANLSAQVAAEIGWDL